jgi:hypothetical protein
MVELLKAATDLNITRPGLGKMLPTSNSWGRAGSDRAGIPLSKLINCNLDGPAHLFGQR